ncbi:hypothetical protein BVRB_2g042440 [Beta vulgaris subsp. vulgaris]|nr:hypothetical protein BVRB_2g042440 [Beta vulgaris subsp. vulgaris]
MSDCPSPTLTAQPGSGQLMCSISGGSSVRDEEKRLEKTKRDGLSRQR